MAVGSPCLKTATYTGPTRDFPHVFLWFFVQKNAEKWSILNVALYERHLFSIRVRKKPETVLMGYVV